MVYSVTENTLFFGPGNVSKRARGKRVYNPQEICEKSLGFREATPVTEIWGGSSLPSYD